MVAHLLIIPEGFNVYKNTIDQALTPIKRNAPFLYMDVILLKDYFSVTVMSVIFPTGCISEFNRKERKENYAKNTEKYQGIGG